LAVDGIWAAAGYARCESDAECAPEVLDVPGGEGSYKCLDFMPMMPDLAPVLGEGGEPVLDPETEEPVQQPVVPRRCAPNAPLPIGAIPYE
jgi:hypothetical protein